jgi:D-alanyl-D-alanine carboxypeptidase (penicillin-binding protein 5/6)
VIFLKKIFIIILTLISTLFISNTYALDNIELHSANYLIYDMTYDEVVASNNSDKVTAMASLTKIMTTIVAIENISNLDDYVTFRDYMKEDIDSDATLAGLIDGNQYTYRDLLYASMLPSGADATNTLAYSLCGSVDAFVNLMNEKAKSLGMNNTNYVNVTGLDRDNHYSSIDDIFILLNYSLKNETFKTVYTTKSYKLTNTLKKSSADADPYEVKSTVTNAASRINVDVSRILGAKTGYTDNAGQCISFIFNSNGHDYLAITTQAPYVYNGSYNIRDALSIIDYIDNNYNNQILVSKGTSVASIKVNLAKIDSIDVVLSEDVTKYLSNDYDVNKVSINYDGLNEINYNYLNNSKLGVITVSYDGNVIHEEDVVLDIDLQFSLIKFIKKYKYILVLMLSCLFLLIILNIMLFMRNKRNNIHC